MLQLTRFDDGLATVIICLCELHNQNGILCGEANQHDKTNGRNDVVFKASNVQCDVSTENRYRCA